MRRSISILAAAFTAGFVASPAIADDTRAAVFTVSDADFATPMARAALHRRIQSAAEEVCGANAVAEGVSWGAIKACRIQVRQDIDNKLASLKQPQGVRLSAR